MSGIKSKNKINDEERQILVEKMEVQDIRLGEERSVTKSLKKDYTATRIEDRQNGVKDYLTSEAFFTRKE